MFHLKDKIGKGRFFYATLAVCLAVVGTVTYLGAKGLIKIPTSVQTTRAEETTKKQLEQTTNLATEETKKSEPKTTQKTTEPISAELVTEEIEQAAARPNIKRAAEFSMPMGTTIGKDFSNGELVQSKTMGDWRVHNGIDFKGTTGDPVKAVNNGNIIKVYEDAMWGTVVEIDHGDGMIARYCGLGKGSTVVEGESIKINDKIGNLGTVPIEIGEDVHLHFEILQDGVAVDPLIAMGKTDKGE